MQLSGRSIHLHKTANIFQVHLWNLHLCMPRARDRMHGNQIIACRGWGEEGQDLAEVAYYMLLGTCTPKKAETPKFKKTKEA